MKPFTRVLTGLERRIRIKLYSLGNKVQCPYCGWTGFQFLPAGAARKPNRLCPKCGSLERYRMLLLYLKNEKIFLDRQVTVLDIAPRACFQDFARTHPNVTYISSDLSSKGAMLHSDLTRMSLAGNCIDLLICFHVMEHIPDDMAAFAEMHRLLKPGGVGLIMVPLCGDKTFDDPAAHPEDYERLFGQHDHVRVYGIDIVDRMICAGLRVNVLNMFDLFQNTQMSRSALYGDDQYIFRICKSK